MLVIPNITATDEANENDISKMSFNKSDVKVDMPKGASDNELGGESASVNGKSAMFNPWYVTSLHDNIYTDANYASSQADILPNMHNLLTKGTGANKYDDIDFLYTHMYGEVSNNRMITLRRFMYPCFDDIFSSNQTEPDVGRLVTFFDDENNKLEEIMSMQYGMKWKELTSASEQAQQNGDSEGTSGYMKGMVRMLDPAASGQKLQGSNELSYDPQHDGNKVYGPVDSIASTNIRDVGLDFNQEINLTFIYDLKSINGVNPKAAFVDLLSNVLAVTTNDAKFWGGARHWVGGRPSKWAKELREFNNSVFQSKMQGDYKSLKTHTANFAAKLGAAANPENLANNILNMAMGSLLNKVGRAAIPTMNSLLTGNPVGVWHVTIGNPLRPIATMGNMILTSTNVQPMSETLGIDDFPTKFKIICTLKHAMPRGRAEIESIFNMGRGRTYWKPTEAELQKIIKNRPASMKGFEESSIRNIIRDNYPLQRNK